MKAIKLILEVIAWFAIVLSPLTIGVIIGGIIYLYKPDTLGLIFATLMVGISLLLGIVYATRIWKTRGTVNFIARIRATPELDEDPEQNPAIKKKE